MDNLLMLRDGSSSLTATEVLGSVKIGPMTPGASVLWLHVDVPAATGTLDVKADFQNASAVSQGYSQMKQISAVGHYAFPLFTLQPNLVVTLTVGTGPFGATKVWIDTAYRYDKAS